MEKDSVESYCSNVEEQTVSEKDIHPSERCKGVSLDNQVVERPFKLLILKRGVFSKAEKIIE